MRKVGIYGGSFDPIHHGHLILARQAMEELELDEVVFVPAAQSPFKLEGKAAPASLRLEMVRSAVADEPGFSVSDIEMHRPPPSYTVDTIRDLISRDPGARMFLLIGDDNLADLHKWHEITALRELVTFVVLARDATSPVPDDMILVHRRIAISSTEIRNRVAQGRSIRYLVPMGIARLIDQQGLYRNV